MLGILRAGEVHDEGMALVDQKFHRLAGGLHIVYIHQMRPDAPHFLQEHERRAMALELEEVREVYVVAQDRCDDQPVHLALRALLHDPTLYLVASLGAAHRDQIPMVARHLLDAEQDLGVVRVRGLFDDERNALARRWPEPTARRRAGPVV